MDQCAVITGLGLVTPLGMGVDATWRALLAGEFIRDHSRVRLDDSQVRHGRVHALAIHAAQEAIQSAGWNTTALADPDAALIVGTSKGPIENWLDLHRDMGFQPMRERSAHGRDARVTTDAEALRNGIADIAAFLADQLGHGHGPRSTYSAACASGLHALIQSILLLRSGVARRALVVAAEASVHPLFIGSFKRLGVIPREGIGCRPLDRDRDGFLISEAAAAVCVELCSNADQPRRGVAVVDRIAMAADATHLTGADPEGRPLRHVLRQVIDARPVDLIHAHATGTVLNDPIELAAIEGSLSDDISTLPNIYSHKAAIGHSLGAAGLVSVVLNCISHRNGLIPPNVQTPNPLPARNVVISNQSVRRPVRRSIAIAAGFGGAIGAVSLTS